MQRKGKLCARKGRFGKLRLKRILDGWLSSSLNRGIAAAAFLAAALVSLPAQSPNAAALLQESLGAHGGAQALARLGDTVSTGRVRQGLGGPSPTEHDFRIEARGSEQWRTSLQGSGRLTVRAFDGGFGWVTGRSVTRPLTARAAANRINPFNPVLGLFRAQSGGEISFESLGPGEVGGRPVHRISALRREGNSLREERGRPIDRLYEVAIDAETLLVTELALASNDWDSQRPDMWERYEYSDYRLAEGLMVPFRVLKSRYGEPEQEIVLTDFQPASLEEGFPRPDGGN